MHSPDAAAGLAAATNTLRARGLRVSAARRRLLEALFAAARPVAAEDLAVGSDLASVYRNLDTLERVGLVSRLQLGDGPRLYAVGEREYALCARCRTLRPLAREEAEAVRRAVTDACGFEARFSRFPLVGACPECTGHLRTVRDEF